MPISVTNGRGGLLYDLGEGKGQAELTHAIEQFKAAGFILGKNKIRRQYIVINRLPDRKLPDGTPEWSLGKNGELFFEGELFTEANGKIIFVRVVGEL
ncbi:hypothetical protein Enr17x_02150 [Gimesia fumaroli]|uniref:Uncharacterized protein n=2 Tax=Gimesia fumaroli TaxID=2527976 RepID=A0A518I517_9PLAN|nr:hypothetical protein Enr17x_02150 [Gimesia fumaroli]